MGLFLDDELFSLYVSFLSGHLRSCTVTTDGVDGFVHLLSSHEVLTELFVLLTSIQWCAVKYLTTGCLKLPHVLRPLTAQGAPRSTSCGPAYYSDLLETLNLWLL